MESLEKKVELLQEMIVRLHEQDMQLVRDLGKAIKNQSVLAQQVNDLAGMCTQLAMHMRKD